MRSFHNWRAVSAMQKLGNALRLQWKAQYLSCLGKFWKNVAEFISMDIWTVADEVLMNSL
ncbi:MAG: hypothetical protein EOP85_16380 [Verrucomicrobiaceae bacterium]|nr:MAG: hypothetical protein EOP85_16380 [Verrucomicrobiaceae bacterium]